MLSQFDFMVIKAIQTREIMLIMNDCQTEDILKNILEYGKELYEE